MKLFKVTTLAVCLLAIWLLVPRTSAQPVSALTVLHNFGLTNAALERPNAPVVQGPNGILYGTTLTGEAGVNGGIFEVNTNGTGFTVLKYFTNSIDGANPQGNLVLSGNTLYGTTAIGGTNEDGVVFSINTDGMGFTNLYSFSPLISGTNSGGANPQAGLVLSGNTLYGTAVSGGVFAGGTVFAINTDGTGYTNLYSFGMGGNGDGSQPYAGLVLSSGTLYGATRGGGTNFTGTVFAINTDGTDFTNLYTFSPLISGTNSDGANPYATLILSGDTLYGTAKQGGTNNSGTLFAINSDGTGFTNLYTFSATAFDPLINPTGGYTNSDGCNPQGALLLSGGTLYGIALQGGVNARGTMFSIGTNGTGFITDHELGTGVSDGAELPNAGSLVVGNAFILSGGTLYGTTDNGGSEMDGTIFSISTNGTGYATVFNIGPVNVGNPQAGLILSGNRLFGTTQFGGTNNEGAVFAVNTDGTGFTNLYNFSALVSGDNSDGAIPKSDLILSGNTLYGTTMSGGSKGVGTIYSINTNGTGFSAVHSFGGNSGINGTGPEGGLVLSGSTLYGTTANNGGGSGKGVVFSMNISGMSYTLLHSFSALVSNTNSDGANPDADLILSGGTLYGTASAGGAGGWGTVFAVSTGGSGFTNLHSFSALSSQTNSDGAKPSGLFLSDGTLYGTAQTGGTNGNGVLYAVNTNGTGFTILHTFNINGDGQSPQGNLILSGNTLYGVAGGYGGGGTLFAINTNGTGYVRLYSLNFTTDGGISGGLPTSGGLVLSGSILYGTTQDQGAGGDGTVFAVTPLPIPLALQAPGSAVVLTWTNPLLSLYAAPAVTGVYTNIPAAYSPYTNTITVPQQFFQLQSN